MCAGGEYAALWELQEFSSTIISVVAEQSKSQYCFSRLLFMKHW